ncbi:TraM recognition domain-containing protein [Rhizobium leguminosarum]|uniref:TraM recognition domain-containing protein n=1 Tax=Rhizobium leguminosarum TaxID=384 RepID=UPI001C965190|nr:TraM recognition domain-containing protein [Rhizobium leguminosarum]MBY5819843.1 TraM recognition domain-containing protein [Rhizobium leguminosarum]
MLKRVSKALVKSTDILFATNASPELRGNLVLAGEQAFPRKKYPEMWVDIPDDVRISPVIDGKLVNNANPAELSFADMTEDRIVNALQGAGRSALKLTAALAAGVSLICYPFIVETISLLPPFPSWAVSTGAYGVVVTWGLQTTAALLWTCGILALKYGWPLALLVPVFWWNGFTAAMSRMWNGVSWGKRLPTLDYHVRHETEQLDREDDIQDYRDYVLDLVSDRMKDEPVFPIGEARGLMELRNVRCAPRRGSWVSIDGESIRRHMIAFGDTGTGKTRRFLMPMFRRVVIEGKWKEGRKIGAYVTDGKGVLAEELLPVCKPREEDVRVIGIGEDHYGVDLLGGMTPEQIRETVRKVITQLTSEGAASQVIWTEMPTQILYHAARIGLALETNDEAKQDFIDVVEARPYSLYGMYQLAAQEDFLKAAIKTIHALDADKTLGRTERQEQILKQAVKSCSWMDRSFIRAPKDTKGSYRASIESVLSDTEDGGIGVAHRFFSGIYEGKITDVDHALNGGIIMVALGAGGAGGSSGHLVSIWLKNRLMSKAIERQQRDPQAAKDNSCCLLADEVQLLLTTGKSKDATHDGNFWNIARSTGVFMMCATQNFSSLVKAVGSETATVFVNNMSSVVLFKTKDKATIDYYEQKLGKTNYALSTLNGVYPNFASVERKFPSSGGMTFAKLIECLLPKTFNPSTQPGELYDISWYHELNASLHHDKQGHPAEVRKYLEQKIENAKKEAQEMRPKLEEKDLTKGQGNAFVMIERGEKTRYDLVALEPLINV